MTQMKPSCESEITRTLPRGTANS